MNEAVLVPIESIHYEKRLYPRLKPDPKKIIEYSENIENLPAIEINQDNILIDGYHRWKAYETKELGEIPCVITKTENESELEQLAVLRNATHGQQLTREEKVYYASKWWGILSDERIRKTLSISRQSLDVWTKTKREQQEKQKEEQIYDLWLSCHTQEEIAESVNVSQPTVNEKIANFIKIANIGDSDIFRNFMDEGGDGKIYTLWNFSKNNNGVKHFGNVPKEIIDNLLYYYTNPLDVVFDPFGGGGSTIDVCIERKRRYYVSDLTPIPARADIRQHDITTGIPKDCPVPDFVFLDPPYWKQAAGKYSNCATDLSNVDLETFLSTIGNITRDIKRKWNGDHQGKLALIIGPLKENGKMVDLPFLCYGRISKYLTPIQRICVPYSTQVHGGNFVKLAKEKKELLYLTRDLMVFQP
jgi:DNA-binding CsgD family transcriptional regulator